MNPSPCIAIEAKPINAPGPSTAQTQYGNSYGTFRVVRVYTRTQIRKGLIRVWRPGEQEYYLWIPQEIDAPQFRRNGARWWQPPAQT